MEYRSLNKKARSCMYVATFINTLIGLAILIGIYLPVKEIIPEQYKNIVTIVIGVIIVISILDVLIAPAIRFKRYKYCINEEKIDVIEGWFFITREIVPIERLHKITVKKGPIDNIFGLAKVIVTTAGGDVIIRFLEEEKADEIAESLKTKINQIVKSQEVK